MTYITEQPNNLNTFRILFLVKGILTLCLTLFPIIYIIIGGFMYSQIERTDPHMPFNPAIIFIIFGSIGVLFLTAIGILDLMSSKHIKNRTGYNFVFVSSIIGCLTGVLGILLCIFTLIEISKPHVKQLFGKA